MWTAAMFPCEVWRYAQDLAAPVKKLHFFLAKNARWVGAHLVLTASPSQASKETSWQIENHHMVDHGLLSSQL